MIRLTFTLAVATCTGICAVLLLRCRRPARPQVPAMGMPRSVNANRLPDAPAIEMGGVWVDPENPALLAAAAVVEEFAAISDLYIGGETS